ncbi:MAG: T9SS type A sorting domain-containing protein [Saprospiraceae bacterium]|nr:T9SS type A sorting domain-containing protein [Saprospiraceae bacterium]
MHKINSLVLFFLLVLSFLNLHAQEKADLLPCGTHMGRSPWLKNFQKNPSSYATRGSEVLYVPITVHLVGNDNGDNLYREQSLLQAFCRLNDDFLSSGIQFYLAGEIKIIRKTEYAAHNTIRKGAEMMFANNVPNTLNTYIVGNAGGFCGYNLPYAGIVVAQTCAKPNDHTWAHEVGHHFALPHPFLGWEGGVSWNNTVAHNYNNPAPERITYDYTLFKDVYYEDTLIIDTAYVERVDRSNCTYAGDGFCDTPADYLYNRWGCNNTTKFSNTEQTDPVGEKFKSDGSLIMSYSLDVCSSNFTPDQMSAMRAYLIDKRSNYLHGLDVPNAPSANAIQYVSPLNGETVFFRNVDLEWEPVEGATHYLVQVASSANFGIVYEDTIVNDYKMTFLALRNNSQLFWRVKPMNSHYLCAAFTTHSSLRTNSISSVNEEETENWVSIRPTIITDGYFIIESKLSTPVKIQVFDTNGKIVKHIFNIRSDYTLNTESWTAGVYFIRIDTGDSTKYKRVIITK